MRTKVVTRNRGNQKIKIEVIEAVLELLDKLEPKPKPKLSKDEKLLNLRHKIERVLRLGYSYAEVTEVLKHF